MLLSMVCEAVASFRVSPRQKSEVVSLVRATNKKVRALKIDDGAKDVAIIYYARAGDCIWNQEGIYIHTAVDRI